MPPQDGGVRFENQGEEFGPPASAAKPDFDMTGKLVKWGFVSSREQAQGVLYAVLGVVVLLLVWVLWTNFF